VNLPANVPDVDEAERALLASVLVKPDVLDEVSGLVDANDFRQPSHAEVWKAISRLRGDTQPVDVISVLNAIKGKPGIPDNAYAWLAELFIEGGYQAWNAEYYARQVRDRSVKERLVLAAIDITKAACDGDLSHEDCLSLAEKRITELRDAKADSRLLSVQDAMVEGLVELEERRKGRPPGMPFGFWPLDRITSLRPGQLWIVAARPSHGKSAFALNVACNAATEHPVLFCSLEMTRQEIVERIIADKGGVNSEAISVGTLSRDQWERVIDASNEVSQWKLFLDDNPHQTVGQIASKARRLKRRYGGMGLVVVDYLQLIQPERGSQRETRNEQIAQMTRALKTLAMELEWPVMVLSQLNRSADGERPRLSQLRDSGAIEQDANNVLFVHRQDVYRSASEPKDGKAEFIIAKQRGGPPGECELIWRGEHFRFEAPPLYENFDEDYQPKFL